MAKRDVSLIIRARDEASKAFDAAASTLESLLSINDRVAGSATKTGNRLQDLAAIALQVDKAFGTIDGAANRAAAAFDRQQAAIGASRAQLASLKAQAEAAAQAIARLQSADAIVAAGRDQSGRLAQLRAITVEYDRLTTEQTPPQCLDPGV